MKKVLISNYVACLYDIFFKVHEVPSVIHIELAYVSPTEREEACPVVDSFSEIADEGADIGAFRAFHGEVNNREFRCI